MEITEDLIIKCILVGLFTIVIGFFTERTLNKCDRKNNFLTKLKNNYIYFIIILFLFGVFIHIISVYSGFEAYCEKKCVDNVCKYVCTVKINAGEVVDTVTSIKK
jgi:hypothetical protein